MENIFFSISLFLCNLIDIDINIKLDLKTGIFLSHGSFQNETMFGNSLDCFILLHKYYIILMQVKLVLYLAPDIH